MKNLKHFYVGVKGVLYNPTLKKVLVLSKLDQKGKRFWDIPGGRIDGDEKVEETLDRELREEVLNIEDDYKVGGILNAYRLSRDLKDGMGLLLIFYKIESEIEKVSLSKEHDKYMWVGLDELSQLDSAEAYIESGYMDALKAALTQ